MKVFVRLGKQHVYIFPSLWNKTISISFLFKLSYFLIDRNCHIILLRKLFQRPIDSFQGVYKNDRQRLFLVILSTIIFIEISSDSVSSVYTHYRCLRIGHLQIHFTGYMVVYWSMGIIKSIYYGSYSRGRLIRFRAFIKMIDKGCSWWYYQPSFLLKFLPTR